jgi:hypothetical protein
VLVVEVDDSAISAAQKAAIGFSRELLKGRTTEVAKPAAGVDQRAIRIDCHRITPNEKSA